MITVFNLEALKQQGAKPLSCSRSRSRKVFFTLLFPRVPKQFITPLRIMNYRISFYFDSRAKLFSQGFTCKNRSGPSCHFRPSADAQHLSLYEYTVSTAGFGGSEDKKGQTTR